MQTILILDHGSQYTQLIARKVREANVYCEIHPYNKIPEITDEVKDRLISFQGQVACVGNMLRCSVYGTLC